MKEICYKPIGEVKSPFKKPEGTPIQPPAAEGVEGRIELLPEFAAGLKDIEGFSHLILLYDCHLAGECSLLSTPFMEDREHGVFSIRAPSRPNSIGLSIVRLIKREENTLLIKDVDLISGTPLLDIKPYVPAFDARNRDEVSIGWLEKNIDKLPEKKDDGRFSST
ncbi:MAG: tRNA (N6-threonylcarbamoyladenosine(37)-N6)-methyltransferase TrmO [Halanaerobiaceae bacterium]